MRSTPATLFICLLPLLCCAEPAARQLVVAAVQFESVDGDIGGNLKTAEGWLQQAVAANAELIVFPEFMPTGYHLGPAIWESGEGMTGPTVSWLVEQSARYRVWLGTSFLEVEGEHFFDTFV